MRHGIWLSEGKCFLRSSASDFCRNQMWKGLNPAPGKPRQRFPKKQDNLRNSLINPAPSNNSIGILSCSCMSCAVTSTSSASFPTTRDHVSTTSVIGRWLSLSYASSFVPGSSSSTSALTKTPVEAGASTIGISVEGFMGITRRYLPDASSHRGKRRAFVLYAPR